MYNFYPGPSKLYPAIPAYFAEACSKGILSMNHRSAQYMELYEQVKILLQTKLEIPESYSVFFISSATEAWEIIAQSYQNLNTLHIHNGSFGEKWHQYSSLINPNTKAISYGINENIPVKSYTESALLAITQNETSNGTQVDSHAIGQLRELNKEALIAVDVTSSLGGISLPIAKADIWFASVQKCLGMPSGMGILICSPAAIEKANTLNNNQHYNSIIHNYRQSLNKQPTHTPNIAGVYLLKRVLEDNKPVSEISEKIKKHSEMLYQKLTELTYFNALVATPALRSDTVIALETSAENIAGLKKYLSDKGIVIGNGYGKWKENTIRIANFPAIDDAEYTYLLSILQTYNPQ